MNNNYENYKTKITDIDENKYTIVGKDDIQLPFTEDNLKKLERTNIEINFIVIHYYYSLKLKPIPLCQNFSSNIDLIIIILKFLIAIPFNVHLLMYLNKLPNIILIIILLNLSTKIYLVDDTNQKLKDFLFKLCRNDAEQYDIPVLEHKFNNRILLNYTVPISILINKINYNVNDESNKFIISMLKVLSGYYTDLNETFTDNREAICFILKHVSGIISHIHHKFRFNKAIINELIKKIDLKRYYSIRETKLKFFHISIGKKNTLHTNYTDSYIEYKYIDLDSDLDSDKLEIKPNIDEYMVIFIDIPYTTIQDIKPLKPQLNTNKKKKWKNKWRRRPITFTDSLDQYITSRNEELMKKVSEFYKKMQEFIDTAKREHTKYVTIINYYKLFNKTLLLKHNNYFHKILNITLVSEISDNTTQQIGNYKFIKKWLNPKKDKYFNHKLLATHWINKEINTPYELKNSQNQISGTCYMNAIFNSIMLISKLYDKIYKQISEYKKDKEKQLSNETITDIFNYDDLTLKDAVFTIIGNIYDNLSVTETDDLMLILAAHIKSINSTELNYYINKINMQDSTKLVYTYCGANTENKLRKKICYNSGDFTNIDLKKLNKVCQYGTDSVCDDTDNIYKKKGYIYGEAGGWTHVIPFITLFFKQIKNSTDVSPYNYIDIGETNPAIIYIYSDGPPDIPFEETPIITIDQIQYRLSSAYIAVIPYGENSEAHALCGIITKKNEYYIYDSNNNYYKEDWREFLDGKETIIEQINDDTNESNRYQIKYIILMPSN